MGLRGPMPKRPEDLAGHVSRARRDGDELKTVTISNRTAHKSAPPTGVADWSASAKLLFKAAKNSAQSSLYEPSDWEVLRTTLVDLSTYQENENRNSQYLAGINSVLDDLLLTEGARRRRGVILEAHNPPIKPPAANGKWCKDAKRLWKAAKAGQQVQYYQPSDWAYLHFTLTELTQHRLTNSSGLLFTTINSMLSNLLLTEGTRRQQGLDLGTAEEVSNDPTPGDKEVAKWLVELTPVA